MRILKVGDKVLENFEIVRIIETEDGKIEEIYAFDTKNIKEYIKDTVIWLAKIKIKNRLEKAGFYDLGDVIAYKDSSDQDAINIFEWYQRFDAAVFQFIETLSTKAEKELIEIDLKRIVDSFEEMANGN